VETVLLSLLIFADLHDVRLVLSTAITVALVARLESIARPAEAWQTILELRQRAYERPEQVDTGEFLLANGRGCDRRTGHADLAGDSTL
jgi:hypothetical protein